MLLCCWCELDFIRFYFNFIENEFFLFVGYLRLIKIFFICEGVDKKGLGK